MLLAMTCCAVLAGTFTGCGREPATRGSGVRVTVLEQRDPPLPAPDYVEPIRESAPARIVSLIPSATEVIFALGMGDRLIGVDRWADWPPEVARLPRLGDLNKIQIEKILDARADLVLLFSGQEDAAEILRRAGIRVVRPPTESAAELFAGILAVAEACGVPGRGAQLVAEIRATMDAARARVAERARRRVLVIFERHPSLSVATRTSFIQTLVEDAGGINVSENADGRKHFTYATLEQVLDWRPDVIIDLTAGLGTSGDAADSEAFWKQAYPGTVEVFVPQAPVLSRPGPRFGAAVEMLARLIHGV